MKAVNYEEDVLFGSHTAVWGSWYDTERKVWGYACCKGLKRKSWRCGSNAETQAEVGAPEDEIGQEAGNVENEEVRVSRRMADMLEKCPSFAGGIPTLEVEKEWTDAELRNYIFSNGLIRPARRRGGQTREPVPADYKALDLKAGADADAVRKAYKRLALVHHPDKQRGTANLEKAQKKFQELVAAYEAILGHIAEVPPPPSSSAEAYKRRIVVVEA
mmetsp:Transcript_42831/g.80342  ORF Transcript_42831/g.80342 Transcript_42831/m.80342 type:complete len:217 (+) Transcript_42831:181-831(+)